MGIFSLEGIPGKLIQIIQTHHPHKVLFSAFSEAFNPSIKESRSNLCDDIQLIRGAVECCRKSKQHARPNSSGGVFSCFRKGARREAAAGVGVSVGFVVRGPPNAIYDAIPVDLTFYLSHYVVTLVRVIESANLSPTQNRNLFKQIKFLYRTEKNACLRKVKDF